MSTITTIRTTTNQLTFSTIEPGSGLRAALARPSADALRKVESSGLRGRGGAGFPTSLKWELAAKSGVPAERVSGKYVVCNADEGEPGTFKDRVILAEFADLVFEGMTIGAWVIGAAHGHRLPPRGIHLSSPAPGGRVAAATRRRPAGARGKRTPTVSPSTSPSAWAQGPTFAARKRP